MRSVALFGLILSLAPLLTLASPPDVRSPEGPLVVEGEIVAVTMHKVDTGIELDMDIVLHFRNRGHRRLILLRPMNDQYFGAVLVGGISIARSESDAAAGIDLLSEDAWPSRSVDDDWRELARMLDTSHPPSALTMQIEPGQSWDYQIQKPVRVAIKDWNNGTRIQAGWETIRGIATPLWIVLRIGMWPSNLDEAAPDLGTELKSEWNGDGDLIYDPESTHNIVQTLPMILQWERLTDDAAEQARATERAHRRLTATFMAVARAR